MTRVRPPPSETASGEVGLEIDFLCDSQNARTRPRADMRIVVQDARDGGAGNSSFLCDFFECERHGHLVLGALPKFGAKK
jgi:hypothetical protein